MQLGPEGPVVEILGGTQVNVTQATVQDVIAEDSMHRLPINARDLFDFAQLDPDVQMQDGGVLDATKNGISSISLLSRYGSNPRISVDGADVNDEIVGAPTQNIPAGADEEFQVSRSVSRSSTPPTDSGAVNVITRSGSDQIHGGVFGLFRGDEGAASLPGRAPQSFRANCLEDTRAAPSLKTKFSGSPTRSGPSRILLRLSRLLFPSTDFSLRCVSLTASSTPMSGWIGRCGAARGRSTGSISFRTPMFVPLELRVPRSARSPRTRTSTSHQASS